MSERPYGPIGAIGETGCANPPDPTQLGEPAAEPQPEVECQHCGEKFPTEDRAFARCPKCKRMLSLFPKPAAPAPAASLGDDDYLSDLDRALDERDEANHEVARLSAELEQVKAERDHWKRLFHLEHPMTGITIEPIDQCIHCKLAEAALGEKGESCRS